MAELTQYGEGVANGDPIVVYNTDTGTITLGTGFTSYRDIKREIDRVVDNTENKRFDVFQVDGHIDFV